MFLDSMRINILPPPRIKSEEEFVHYPKKSRVPTRGASIQTFTITIATHIYSTSTTPACTCYEVQISFSYDYFGLNPLGGVGSLSLGNVPERQNLFSYPYVDSCTVTVGCVRHLLLQCENASEKYPVLRLHASNRFSRSIGFRNWRLSRLATTTARLRHVPRHFSVSPPLARSHAEHP